MPRNFELIGRGVYTVAEAARFTRIPERRLHRWTQGYQRVVGGRRRTLPPAIGARHREADGAPVLEFLDLIEARFLNAFLNEGVSWPTIHLAAKQAAEILHLSHPFSSQRFFTDGRAILMQLASETGDSRLLDLVRDQFEFERVVSPFLRSGLEYSPSGLPQVWRPISGRVVVLDPRRAFGAPIVEREGVPTAVLAKAVAVNDSVDEVAWWFDVASAAIRDAVAFEQSIAS